MKSKVIADFSSYTCQLCGTDCNQQGTIYDAIERTSGRWALLCTTCFARRGAGLGTGIGQRFDRQPDGTFLKTAG